MLLLTSFVILVISEAVNSDNVKCGLPVHQFNMNKGNRIVGGWEAIPHSIPWQVYMIFYDSTMMIDATCGGSLVHLMPGNGTRYVLTAAHCVRHRESKEYRHAASIDVVIGGHNMGFYEPRVVVGVSKYTHGHYSHKTKKLDIALLQLATEVQFTDTILPICLPRSRTSIPVNVPCFVSGWGYTQYGDPSNTLQVVDVQILDDADCNIEKETQDKSFCAGHLNGGKDACLGDSGDPSSALNMAVSFSTV
uniref:Peptidase S1 domain-containing protein n=1 Tax=Trichuris muris TaxID=70415 RepID=A0A5S6QXD0_TRIMR